VTLTIDHRLETDEAALGETPQGGWAAMTPDAALERVLSTRDGLAAVEADRRLATFGPNVVPRGAATNPWKVAWRQINEPLIWVLIGAAVAAFALGKVEDGIVVAAVVVVNAMIGFLQEYKASRAVEALAAMVPEYATVRRDGTPRRVQVASLVPGDVVQLAAGDEAPADLRLLSASGLSVQEAALTGESVPSIKGVEPVAPDAAIGDRSSMVFGGTLVTGGRGSGLVVETGGRTEFGRMSTMLNDVVELQTPLTKAMARIGVAISIGVVALAGLMLVIGTMRAVANGVEIREASADAAVFAISLAVGAIPEGLPAIVTVALAVGVRRMASRRAIVRSLPAVETLGSTSVVCTDKTGTLTRNEMVVRTITTDTDEIEVTGVGYEPLGRFLRQGREIDAHRLSSKARALLRDAALCNDAALDFDGDGRRWSITGDPTEGALVVVAEKAAIDVEAERRDSSRIGELPFDSTLQMMAVRVESEDGTTRIVVKGSPEAVFARSTLTEEEARQALGRVDEMASRGLRVLAIASRPVGAHRRTSLLTDEDLIDLEVAGTIGMMDPPRPEAVEAIAACHDAGISVKMITGDHAATATAIGREIGLRSGRPAITGAELARADDEELDRIVDSGDVFARVAPEHKLRLVQALQRRGAVVAMTGDGTNDAPALKQADVGVAMGITGTSVSKEAADLVLTDDDFTTIRGAIEEGRRVYDNLIKSLAFVLPTNLALALILMVAVAFFPFDDVTGELLLPIQPVQILWINLVASIALAVPLAFEAPERDVMRRPPRDPGASPLSRYVVWRTMVVAALIATGAIGLSIWEYSEQLAAGVTHAVAIADAQTMAVTAVIFCQIAYVLLSRSITGRAAGVWRSNPAVLVGIVAILVLQLGFVYLPVAHAVFGTAPLTPQQLGVAALVAIGLMSSVAAGKSLRSRRAQRRG
jgi:Ca2+-transporting ATPase